jgi:hypothetical protein
MNQLASEQNGSEIPLPIPAHSQNLLKKQLVFTGLLFYCNQTSQPSGRAGEPMIA